MIIPANACASGFMINVVAAAAVTAASGFRQALALALVAWPREALAMVLAGLGHEAGFLRRLRNSDSTKYGPSGVSGPCWLR